MHVPDESLSDLERRLAAWRPAPAGIDRDRLLYESGRNAVRSGWRLAAGRLAIAALLLVCVVQGGLLARERGRRHALEVSLVQARAVAAPAIAALADAPPPEFEPGPPPGPSSYLALSRRLVTATAEPSAPGHDATAPGASTPGESLPLRAFDLGRAIDL
jgi:hypothetical protein